MHHNVMKRLHWWSMSQTGPRNPEVQKAHISEEEMGEYLRYVISHELAHALGYPHNQRGNTAYDVEDLRDPEFTRELDRKNTRLNSSHVAISYAANCLTQKLT